MDVTAGGSTDMQVRGLAVASAFLALSSMAAGTFILPISFPGFSSVSQTVSDLGAGGAPTQIPMNVFGIITAVALMSLAVFLRRAAMLGRVLVAAAAISAAMSLVFPKPAPHVDTPAHTAAVTCLAVTLGFWPLAAFASRRRRWSASLRSTCWYTAVAIVLGFTFLFNWLQGTGVTGLLERVFMFTELVATAVFASVGMKQVSTA